MAAPLTTLKDMRIGLLGYGAIGSVVARALVQRSHGLASCPATLAAVLVRSTPRPADLPDDVLFTTDAEAFFAAANRVDVVVECAGQGAVRAYGERALGGGQNLLVTSIGAFTDDALFARLGAVARAAGSRLLLASGAMPAVDWVSASALQQLLGGAAGAAGAAGATGAAGAAGAAGGAPQPPDRVTVTQTKPPESWVGARVDPATGLAGATVGLDVAVLALGRARRQRLAANGRGRLAQRVRCAPKGPSPRPAALRALVLQSFRGVGSGQPRRRPTPRGRRKQRPKWQRRRRPMRRPLLQSWRHQTQQRRQWRWLLLLLCSRGSQRLWRSLLRSPTRSRGS